jgi:hypothetical protein
MASPPLRGSCGSREICFEISAWAPTGGGYVKSFGEVCGSHLFGRAPAAHDFSIVRMAAIDGDPGVRPAARQFVASAAEWEPIPDDSLPRFDDVLPWR